jgi:predicted ester cyclase
MEWTRCRCACRRFHKRRYVLQSGHVPRNTRRSLAAFVKGVWTAIPDFSIEMLNAGEIEPGLVAHHWLIRGTNTGPGADGSEPTGRSFSFKGASIIQVEGDKIRSDQAYFDRKALDQQLAPK